MHVNENVIGIPQNLFTKKEGTKNIQEKGNEKRQQIEGNRKMDESCVVLCPVWLHFQEAQKAFYWNKNENAQ